MKSIRSIILLSVVVMSIITLWLVPGINSAKNAEYIRYYEDTDRITRTNVIADTVISESLRKKSPTANGNSMREKKVYKEERIKSTDKLSQITPSKFSRGAQFVEVVEYPLDSLTLLADTTKIIQ
jgi:hypothetical protein